MTEKDGQLHQISAEIGGLKRSVDLMTDLWKTQDASATAGRQRLHEKFDAFRDAVGIDISALSLRVDRLTDKVTAVEPSVSAFKEEKLRQEGAQRFGAKIYAAMVLAAGVIGWGAHELIVWLYPK